MAYQVLARKWRSQSFSELVGQEHVSTTLLNALKSSRMPHALLFTGARGVGKTSVARILAKSLRCPNAIDFVPCNKCDECLEITQGRAVDVIEIDGASNNGVENIRELRETVGYMPSHGKFKIYIIDEVHMLSTSAFNALLKTLEEPPPHVIFIFATTEPQKIPVTILSRCQRFDFRRIPVKKIVDHLRTIVEAEEATSDSQALWLIGREADGSLRDALSLLDQVITFSGNKITLDSVVDVLGLTDRTLLSDTLRAIVERNASSCLDIIQKVFHHGYDPKQFAQDLLEHLRNLMIVKVALSVAPSKNFQLDFLDLPEQEILELQKVAADLSEEDVHLLFDMTLKGVTDVLRAQDPRIVLEMLLLRLSQAPRLSSIDELLKQIASNPSGAGSSGADFNGTARKGAFAGSETASKSNVSHGLSGTRDDKPAPVVAATPMTPEEKWTNLVSHIRTAKPLLGAKLEYSALTSLSEEKISICFKKEQEFFYNQLTEKEALAQLTDLVSQYWGKKYLIEVKLVEAGGGAPSSPKETEATRERDEEISIRSHGESHPLVKEVKNIVNAQISSIKELR